MMNRTFVLAVLHAACVAAPAFSQCTLNATSPSVTICTPAVGATVSSPVTVVAGTTDNEFPVKLLQIYVDGVKVYQVATATLDTSVTLAAGSHKLTVQAMDSSNRIFKSSITITVGSGGGGTPNACTLNPTQPSVTICTPASGATVTSPVHVLAQANCQCTVSVMQIYLDGTKVFQVGGSVVDTNVTMSNGSH